MNEVELNRQALAIQPRQERGIKRFEAVLQEAEQLLVTDGLQGFSIPILAERLDFTRRSIYKFFPTPYAILNELTQRYLVKLEQLLLAEADSLRQVALAQAIERIADIGMRYYNGHPIARLLILGGPVTDSSYRAQDMAMQVLGNWTRQMMALQGIVLPPAPPDVSTLAVEICFSCYRLSYQLHGEITAAYRDEAAYAMRAYLSRYTSS